MSSRRKLFILLLVTLVSVGIWGVWRYQKAQEERAIAQFYGTWYATGTMPQGGEYHCLMSVTPLPEVKVEGHAALTSFGLVWKQPGQRGYSSVPVEAVPVLLDQTDWYILTTDAQQRIKRQKNAHYDVKTGVLQVHHFSFRKQENQIYDTRALEQKVRELVETKN